MQKRILFNLTISLALIIPVYVAATTSDDIFSEDNIEVVDLKETQTEVIKEIVEPKEEVKPTIIEETIELKKEVPPTTKKRSSLNFDINSAGKKNKPKQVIEKNVTEADIVFVGLDDFEDKENKYDLVSGSIKNDAFSKLISEHGYKENTMNFELVNYKEIKYNKDYLWFSILEHNITSFRGYTETMQLDEATLEELRDRVDSPLAIRTNAYAYDYGLGQPNFAENFYKLFKGNEYINEYERKIRYADFLVRTGRPHLVSTILAPSECLANPKIVHHCLYYLGVAHYLLTGENKNIHLRVAKDGVRKAGEIYNKKR